MNQEKNKDGWFHKHKKALLIAGASVVAVAGTVLVVKNWEVIEGLLTDRITKGEMPQVHTSEKKFPVLLEEAETSISSYSKTIDIREHIRQLPKGQHASAQKIVEATEAGILLGESQTFVSAHSRSYAA